MSYIYIDAVTLQILIESGTYNSLKSEAARQGKFFSTSEVIITELRGGGENVSPEVNTWLLDYQSKIDIHNPPNDYADRIDHNEDALFRQAKIDEFISGPGEVWTQDAKAIRYWLDKDSTIVARQIGDSIINGEYIHNVYHEGILSSLEKSSVNPSGLDHASTQLIQQKLLSRYQVAVAAALPEGNAKNIFRDATDRGVIVGTDARGNPLVWDPSLPKPPGFRTLVESNAFGGAVDELAQIDIVKETLGAKIREIYANPASFVGDALTPNALKTIQSLSKAIVAVAVMGSAIDIVTTVNKIRQLEAIGNKAQAAIEFAALLGRQEGGWMFGLAGAAVGADVGFILGGIIGAFVGPEGIPVGAAIGEFIGSLVGGGLAALLGGSEGDSWARHFATIYNEGARWFLDSVENIPPGTQLPPTLSIADLLKLPSQLLFGELPIDPKNPWDPKNWFDPKDSSSPGHWIANLLGPTYIRHDPLVLDLNYDGVRLTALSNGEASSPPQVEFDLNSDGYAEVTGWVSSDDGLLAVDINNNGRIDDGSELFGSATQNGFEALRSFDTNSDGKISAYDTNFNQLLIWRDKNQNGFTDNGELSSLSDNYISTINLSANISNEIRSGNQLLATSNFVLDNSASHEVVAIAFSTNQINGSFQLPDNFVYDPEVFILPNLHGYGTVPDLWVAMSLDPVLKELVKELVASGGNFASTTDIIGSPYVFSSNGSTPLDQHSVFGTPAPETVYVEPPSAGGGGGNGGGGGGPLFAAHIGYVGLSFDDILFRWALGENSGGEAAAQATAEKFVNHGLLASVNASTDHTSFDLIFQMLSAQYGVRFLAQSGAGVAQTSALLTDGLRAAVPSDGAALSMDEISAIVASTLANPQTASNRSAALGHLGLISYDFRTDGFARDQQSFFDAALEEVPFNPANPWEGINSWYNQHKLEFRVIDPDGSQLLKAIREWSGNAALPALLSPRTKLIGDAENNVIDGDQPRPANYTDTQRDLIYGLGGNDLLRGGVASDTYVFGDGCGSDTILDTSGTDDEIAFQGNLTSSLARFAFANGNRHDLLITFDGRPEAVTVLGYFTDNGDATIEHITFPDGPELSARTVRDAALATLATTGDDTITAFLAGDDVVGGGGNDNLFGNNGSDLLIGGAGNDVLHESSGNDAYIWNLGDGDDVIVGESAFDAVNTVTFGPGISASDIRLTMTTDQNGLILTVAGQSGSITLPYQLATYVDYGIDFIKFDDGTVWDRATYSAQYYSQASTSGDDTIMMSNAAGSVNAGSGSDAIYARGDGAVVSGGAGDDNIYGTNSSSNTTIKWNLGDGNDTVVLGAGGDGTNNVVRFGPGIAPTDIRFAETTDGNGLIVSVAGEPGSITLRYQLSAYADYGIDRFVFDNGIVWDRATYSANAYAWLSSSGDDVIAMANVGGTVSAGAGNDTITVRGDAAIVSGGIGDDTIIGTFSSSNTTIMWNLGDGNDIVSLGAASDGVANTLKFGAGINPNDLRFVVSQDGTGVVISVSGEAGSITLPYQLATYADYGIDRFLFDDGTIWDRKTYSEHIYAAAVTSGDDVLWMANVGGVLNAGAGNDTIHVRGDSVLVTGGLGNDYMYSNAGAHETYAWNLGDGDDTIALAGGGGVLEVALGTGITTADVVLSRTATDLFVTIGSGAGSIKITGQDADRTAAGLGRITFADGSIWSTSDISARLMAGSNGSDFIVGTAGNDVLDGGAGNDMMIGNAGDDTYRFGIGDGEDTIFDKGANAWWGHESGGNDTIELKAGIAPADVDVIQTSPDDVAIRIRSTGDQLKMLGATSDPALRIETVKFDDGSIWTYADLLSRALAPTAGNDVHYAGDTPSTLLGGAGNDTLTGSVGADILAGNTGNDALIGGAGDDIYRFGLGDGADTISDVGPSYWWGVGSGGEDVIELGAGIAPTDIDVIHTSPTDIAIRIRGTGDQLTMLGALTESARRIETVKFDDGTILTFADLAALALQGTAGDDTIYAGGTASTLSGSAGSDTLIGGVGNDVLVGGTGADQLAGGGGGDIYRFARGDGQDVVRDFHDWDNGRGGLDAIEFGSTILPSDVTVSLGDSGRDIVLTINGTSDQVTLDDSIADSDQRIEEVRFANGTTWSYADMLAFASPSTSGDDTITGSESGESLSGGDGNDLIDAKGGNDTVSGDAGNDTLIGGSGNDVLTGGVGNDSLHGGDGNDTYRFSVGDGQDVVREWKDWPDGWGDSDTIEFTAGIDPADIVVTQTNNGNDLVLTNSVTGDSVTLIYTMSWANFRIEQVRFADNTLWSHADLVQKSMAANTGNDVFYGSYDGETLSGGAGNDTLSANNGEDLLIGGIGNDSLHGGDGNDIYRFSVGDGQDIVRDWKDWPDGWGGTDTVEFTAGVDPADIVVTQANSGNDLVLTNTVTGDSVTLVYTMSWANFRIEQVRFADTTLWSHADLVQKSLQANAGNDSFYGSYDGETIDAGAGNDVVDARDGDDRIIGGAGNDSLTGGYGNDVAVFAGLQADYSLATSYGTTTITDDAATTDGDDGTDTLVGIEKAEFKGGVQVGIGAPIILDLNGDGVGLINSNVSSVTFDWEGKGIRRRTGWVDAHDGILVLDRNGDGTVSGANEISFTSDKPGAKSDLDGLTAFDSDGDGKLSSSDARFADFRIWQDANSNGVSDQGELQSLAERGIASITLAGEAVNRKWGWGENLTVNTGSYTLTDGETAALSDVALIYDITTSAAPPAPSSAVSHAGQTPYERRQAMLDAFGDLRTLAGGWRTGFHQVRSYEDEERAQLISVDAFSQAGQLAQAMASFGTVSAFDGGAFAQADRLDFDRMATIDRNRGGRIFGERYELV